jgi:hypothetical protein
MVGGMNNLERLIEWLQKFPKGSEIVLVETSIYEDNARIVVETPDGNIHGNEVLEVKFKHA